MSTGITTIGYSDPCDLWIVSVNLSSQDLFDPALKRTLGEAIRENELSYGDLKLEIRESVCAENKFQIFDIVENLRRAGYEIRIDNFGSENGALSVLSSITVDGLKLDRSAIFEMEQDEKASRLVDLILETAGSAAPFEEKGLCFRTGALFLPPASGAGV